MGLKKLFLFLCALCGANCYNYLAVLPVLGNSHMIVFSPLLRELARKGHNVTLISGYPQNENLPNYRNVDISSHIKKFIEVMEINDENDRKYFQYTGAMLTSKIADLMCEALSSPQYQSFLKENHTFDAIITEAFNTDCFMSIAHKIDAPIISFSSCILPSWMYGRYGLPSNPAYIPSMLIGQSSKTTFLERVENTLMKIAHNLYYKYRRQAKDREVISKYIGSEATDLESYIAKNVLLFVNTHYTINFPAPLVPNVIEVGGIHVGGKPKPLPKVLKKWVDESPNGVIYFSMGSFNKGSTFPKEKMQAFIEAFELLPQRVIWKWESDTMEGKTDKILPYKWIPQLDLLCDPNVKLFISHAGLLGITEAVHCGVPLVLIPQFGDQHNNAKCIESTGAAVILPISKINKETAYEALSKALNLSDNMKELSNRFNDRPMSPLDTAVYWSEYVVRHKGAYFMKSAAIDLPFYQYYLLDVLLFIVSFLILVTYGSYRLLKCMLGLTKSQNSKRKKE